MIFFQSQLVELKKIFRILLPLTIIFYIAACNQPDSYGNYPQGNYRNRNQESYKNSSAGANYYRSTQNYPNPYARQPYYEPTYAQPPFYPPYGQVPASRNYYDPYAFQQQSQTYDADQYYKPPMAFTGVGGDVGGIEGPSTQVNLNH